MDADFDIYYKDLFLRLPNICSCYCEETKTSFKITKAGIDINQCRACKCNYFCQAKHTNIILEICFSIPKTKDILQFLTINMKALSIISNYPTRRAQVC